ncbi:hypothetical protein GPECTOR_3g167 [Gonium pectorale]|uniref:Uncharacterized protein n=1 Tax=Gonium pectorale TaxID=33097 RepID=A0A150GZ35_GONPE|nr:hypothetical protein GPECTOR_3g167 [Gonium pectorale]|eukprot:KXZ55003.1 hypothetical protein GPECTOR_3g167 [Gonium pectorale]
MFESRCLSGDAAIEAAFPVQAAAARLGASGQQSVQLHTRTGPGGDLRPHSAILLSRRSPCPRLLLCRVARLARELGLRHGDAARLTLLPDGRAVVQLEEQQQPAGGKAGPQPELIALREPHFRRGAVDVPLPTMRRLLGPAAVGSRLSLPVRVLGPGSGSGGTAAAAVTGAACTDAQEEATLVTGASAAESLLRSYPKAGRSNPVWLLLLNRPFRDMAAAGDLLSLELEALPGSSGDMDVAPGPGPGNSLRVLARMVRPSSLGGAVADCEGGEGSSPAAAGASNTAAVPPAARVLGAEESGGAGAGARSVRHGGGGETGARVGLVQFSRGLFRGMPALRAAFPLQVRAAEQSRQPQLLTLLARLPDGQLQPFEVALHPHFNPKFMCYLSRVAALAASLGLKGGDRAVLSVLSDSRVIAEAETRVAADPNAVELSRLHLRTGCVNVPQHIVLRLLGPDVATRGSAGPGFPVRVEASDSDGILTMAPDRLTGDDALTVSSYATCLKGPAALRRAFPNQCRTAIQERAPQPVVLHGRLADGRLYPYTVALRPGAHSCSMTRVRRMLGDLGQRPGDMLRLSPQPDGRVILEPLSLGSGAGTQTVYLTKVGLKGSLIVPLAAVSALLGPDVATRGSEGAGMQVWVDCGDGELQLPPARGAWLRSRVYVRDGVSRVEWRIYGQLSAWLRANGAAVGDRMLLSVRELEAAGESSGEGEDGREGLPSANPTAAGAGLVDGRGIVVRLLRVGDTADGC